MADLNVYRKLVVYAKITLGEEQEESWRPALIITAGDFPHLDTKFAGLLLHPIFCISGTAGYLEQAVEEGEDGQWVRVDNTQVVPDGGARWRYQATLDRMYISSSPCIQT